MTLHKSQFFKRCSYLFHDGGQSMHWFLYDRDLLYEIFTDGYLRISSFVWDSSGKNNSFSQLQSSKREANHYKNTLIWQLFQPPNTGCSLKWETEAFIRRCSVKTVFLKIVQISHCVWVFRPAILLERESRHRYFLESFANF